MFQVGVTGGIGSGKSTVAEIFTALKIPVFNADDAAKTLMENDFSLKEKIIREFGEKSYQNGRLNRSFLANTVFEDEQKLRTLNALVHPVVIAYGKEWAEKQSSPYVVKESALFFETDSYKDIDFIIGVSAPEALRIKRVQERNGWSAAEVKARIAKQMDENEKMSRCDVLIYNDEGHSLINQVLTVHRQILILAQQKSGKK